MYSHIHSKRTRHSLALLPIDPPVLNCGIVFHMLSSLKIPWLSPDNFKVIKWVRSSQFPQVKTEASALQTLLAWFPLPTPVLRGWDSQPHAETPGCPAVRSVFPMAGRCTGKDREELEETPAGGAPRDCSLGIQTSRLGLLNPQTSRHSPLLRSCFFHLEGNEVPCLESLSLYHTNESAEKIQIYSGL